MFGEGLGYNGKSIVLIEINERTYENYFFGEVRRLTNQCFSPDPRDEAFLGTDSIFFLPPDSRYFPFSFVRRSRHWRRTGMHFSEVDSLNEELLQRLPNFKFNLFVQYKRPEFLTAHNAGEWPCWRVPYYRYKITPHQQSVMESIVTTAMGRAAVVYASPAFRTFEDLFSIARNEEVIAKSNIASVERLVGHEKFSYVSQGSIGKGHSETKDVLSPTIEEIVDAGMQQKELRAAEHVKRLAKDIREAVRATDQARRLFELALAANGVDGLSDTRREGITQAILTIQAFNDAFETSCVAIS